jgi:hypothetical protein
MPRYRNPMTTGGGRDADASASSLQSIQSCVTPTTYEALEMHKGTALDVSNSG